LAGYDQALDFAGAFADGAEFYVAIELFGRVVFGKAVAAVDLDALAGDADGNFIALDARTGRDLWHVQVGAAIYSTAVTYQLDGRQYVVIPSGSTLFAFALTRP